MLFARSLFMAFNATENSKKYETKFSVFNVKKVYIAQHFLFNLKINSFDTIFSFCPRRHSTNGGQILAYHSFGNWIFGNANFVFVSTRM